MTLKWTKLEVGGNYNFFIQNGPNGNVESFLCEVMPSQTVIVRPSRPNKRNGTNSVYEQAELGKKTQGKSHSINEEKEVIKEHESEREIFDSTSDEDIKNNNNLPIKEFFKFLGCESSVYLYECSFTTDCRQVNCNCSFYFYLLKQKEEQKNVIKIKHKNKMSFKYSSFFENVTF